MLLEKKFTWSCSIFLKLVPANQKNKIKDNAMKQLVEETAKFIFCIYERHENKFNTVAPR